MAKNQKAKAESVYTSVDAAETSLRAKRAPLRNVISLMRDLMFTRWIAADAA
jgi:hypothetical protein